MIYVIRHGQTDWNVLRKTQGSMETDLNTVGISQAKNIRSKLLNTKLDVVLCSPRKRCEETAKIICKDRNIPILELEKLQERNFGEFEGSKKNIDYDWVEFWDWERNKQYEEAENVRTFFERVSNAMEEIKKIMKEKMF